MEPRPFTDRLSILLLVTSLAYFLGALVFVYDCESSYRAGELGALCALSHHVEGLRSVVPGIDRPATIFEQSGDPARAEVFVAALSLSWAGYLLSLLVMAAIVLLRIRLLTDADWRVYIDARDRHWALMKLKTKRRADRSDALLFFVALPATITLGAYWGVEVIGEGGYERNLALYTPAAFLFISLVLSAPLLGWIADALVPRRHRASSKMS